MHLSRWVGSDIAVSEADTTAIKTALHRMGLYEVPRYGMTPYPDEAMFDGVKKLQTALGVEASGSIRPGGAEEEALSAALDGNGGDTGSGGTVHVRAHTRDGDVHVSAYDRSAPGGGGHKAHEPDRPKSPIPNPKYRKDSKGGAFFGDRRKGHTHKGVDIAAKPGTPVTSPGWGNIEVRPTYGPNHPLAGQYTNIWVHGDDGRSYGLYYVTPRDADGNPLVKNGDRVAPGTPIGSVQDRASKDPGMQNHIHFEIEENGRKIDPKPTIDGWIGQR